VPPLSVGLLPVVESDSGVGERCQDREEYGGGARSGARRRRSRSRLGLEAVGGGWHRRENPGCTSFFRGWWETVGGRR
jgi:hypothetical protein